MTSRQARRERREAERKAKKRLLKQSHAHEQLGRFNPELEDEFPRELQMEMNAVRDSIHQEAGFDLYAQRADRSASAPGTISDPLLSIPSHRTQVNRQNAKHSTGPCTAEGKLASSRNSLKHGLSTGTVIIPGENPLAFESLRNDLLKEHQPAGPAEELLVNEMAQSYWLKQRAIRLQSECFTEDGIDEKRLALFLRYQTTHERAFYKALNTLLKLQKSREHKGVVATSGFVSQSAARPNHGFGFVSQESHCTAPSDFVSSQNAAVILPECEESAEECAA